LGSVAGSSIADAQRLRGPGDRGLSAARPRAGRLAFTRLLTPLWSDPACCLTGEDPVNCELRVHRPGIVIIRLETWFPSRAPYPEGFHIISAAWNVRSYTAIESLDAVWRAVSAPAL
jgi:hypothetical protein